MSFGFSAGDLIALFELNKSLTNAVRDSVKSSRDLPEKIRMTLQELESIQMILASILEFSNAYYVQGHADTLQPIVQKLRSTLSDIRDMIASLGIAGSTVSHSAISRFKWNLKSGEMDMLLRRLADFKQTCMLIVTMMTTTVSADVSAQVSAQRSQTSDMLHIRRTVDQYLGSAIDVESVHTADPTEWRGLWPPSALGSVISTGALKDSQVLSIFVSSQYAVYYEADSPLEGE